MARWWFSMEKSIRFGVMGKYRASLNNVGTPFAVVVRFAPSIDESVQSVTDFGELTKVCDRCRDTDNLFYAFRIDGYFTHVHTRAMRATLDGLPLAKAAAI